MAELEELLDSKAVAALLGIKVGTLDLWHHRHIGPKVIKVGSARRYRPSDVEQWLAAQSSG